jgi:dihydroflavonol-4-reductase
MKVLVTGADGFMGRHLTEALVSRGVEVRGMIRPKADPRPPKGVEPFYADLRDADAVREAVRGVDVVYQIAALYRRAAVTDQEYWDINVEGVRNVVDAARMHGTKRLIHCSTIGVYGHVAEGRADENSAYAPGDVYQRTKLEGDLLVQRAIADGLPAVIFRPVAIYGPGDNRLLKLFRGVASGRFPMIGSGRVGYHLVHVRDLIEGILLCGSEEKALGRTYILGGEELTSLRELVQRIAVALDQPLRTIRIPFWPVYGAAAVCEMVCRPLGIEPPLYRRRVDFFRNNRAFDVSRARRELGFSPKVDLRSGLRETAEWYRAQGLL